MPSRRVYVGNDPREDLAYRVCVESLRDHCDTADVSPVALAALRRAGLYRRAFFVDQGQHFDATDGRPFSTEFSFSRFLVPILGQLEARDWVLWCDSDILFRADVCDLFDLADDRYACMVVKHDYHPLESRKMRAGQVQQDYPRKNWSSLILWNCHHPATQSLTTYEVNMMPGRWLHGLSWLSDDQIGALPEEWNWLQSWSDPALNARAVHFTLGTPDLRGSPETPWDAEWLAVAQRFA